MERTEQTCVVYGVGGHGRVVADALECSSVKVAAVVDDDPALHGTELFGARVHGFSWIAEHAKETLVALGIGDNGARMSAAERCRRAGATLLTVVHPSAIIAKSAELGQGVVVLARAVINARAKVGAGCIINTGAIVEHDVEVGDYAHVSPAAVLAGGSRLGTLSHLGAGAVVIDDIFVGARTIVGAGAVVTRHITDDVVSYGVPARVHRRSAP
jgi:UDP-N-acetylbacillosamine N-acetyltransferase